MHQQLILSIALSVFNFQIAVFFFVPDNFHTSLREEFFFHHVQKKSSKLKGKKKKKIMY